MLDETDFLLKEIESFLDQFAMAASAFGRLSLKDDWLVYDLRKGRELRRATRLKINKFMEKHRKNADKKK